MRDDTTCMLKAEKVLKNFGPTEGCWVPCRIKPTSQKWNGVVFFDL